MTYANVADVALGDLIDETTFNQILANLRALYNAPSSAYKADEISNYTVSGSTFVDIDSTGAPNAKFSRRVTLDETGDVLVGFTGQFSHSQNSGTGRLWIDFTLDGVRQFGDDGLLVFESASTGGDTPYVTSFTYLCQNLAAGSHDFVLQWRCSGGTSPVGTLYAGAGTANRDSHPQFWVVKI